jgi:hypothetical protein
MRSRGASGRVGRRAGGGDLAAEPGALGMRKSRVELGRWRGDPRWRRRTLVRVGRRWCIGVYGRFLCKRTWIAGIDFGPNGRLMI